MTTSAPTRFDRLLHRLKDTRAITALLLVSVALSGSAQLLRSVTELRAEIRAVFPTPEDRLDQETRSSLVALSRRSSAMIYRMQIWPVSQRPYTSYIEDYVWVRAELESLLLSSRLQPLNAAALPALQELREMWLWAQARHIRQGTLADADLEATLSALRRMQRAIICAELETANCTGLSP